MQHTDRYHVSATTNMEGVTLGVNTKELKLKLKATKWKQIDKAITYNQSDGV